MTVTYHAGRRLQGLDADRTATALPSGSVGGWVEVGRTTLGSAGASIDVTSIPDKRYYMTLVNMPVSGSNVQPRLRFNADTGTNYSMRTSEDGGADGTSTSGNALIAPNGIYTGNIGFELFYTANLSSKEKLVQRWHVSNRPSTGAGTVPTRKEQVGKWENTSNAINQMEMNSVSNTFATGAEMVVLGWDPADTHTTNFWQELASVNATGSSTNLSSGTITAKKYLWIQIWLDPSTRQNHLLRFNNDTGNNYATRYSTNGGADSTDGSVTNFNLGSGIGTLDGLPSFQNLFIVNNSSNEKLAIIHSVWQNTAGAGNATGRIEMVGKWVNTSSQITEIDVDSNFNWNSGSKIKVWGAD